MDSLIARSRSTAKRHPWEAARIQIGSGGRSVIIFKNDGGKKLRKTFEECKLKFYHCRHIIVAENKKSICQLWFSNLRRLT